MNTRQKIVLAAGLGLIALMILFPPWTASIRIPPVCDARVGIGYGFLLLPPSATDLRLDEKTQRSGCPVTADFNQVDVQVGIDYRKWLIPIALAAGLCATAYFAFDDSTTLPGRGGAPRR
ncbi:MAG: hypothetical protein DCC49_03865 [Acidobacteria bacterium]|nr:MAG: hypothetical protein DCC49_03865 [Acidobacteriota bacterium]